MRERPRFICPIEHVVVITSIVVAKRRCGARDDIDRVAGAVGFPRLDNALLRHLRTRIFTVPK